MKSKFKIFPLMLCLAVVIAMPLIGIPRIIENLPAKIDDLEFRHFFVCSLMAFIWLMITFGELRRKAVFIEIQGNTIFKHTFFVFKSSYNFDEFEGSQTSILKSKAGNYEYLYLLKEGKKAIKVSEQYHRNYKELKSEISKHIIYLGYKRNSLREEFKEIFEV